MTTIPDCSTHKGHRRFVGGSRDGHVDHLVHATPSDFPQTIGTMSLGTQLLGSPRSWYELDYEASEGAEVVYRCVGVGRGFPEAAGDGMTSPADRFFDAAAELGRVIAANRAGQRQAVKDARNARRRARYAATTHLPRPAKTEPADRWGDLDDGEPFCTCHLSAPCHHCTVTDPDA